MAKALAEIWRCNATKHADYAADLHIYAAQAHTAAAAAHHRGDHEAAGELSARAQKYSTEAAEKTEEIARRTGESLRA
jgi:hypothetical protein